MPSNFVNNPFAESGQTVRVVWKEKPEPEPKTVRIVWKETPKSEPKTVRLVYKKHFL